MTYHHPSFVKSCLQRCSDRYAGLEQRNDATALSCLIINTDGIPDTTTFFEDLPFATIITGTQYNAVTRRKLRQKGYEAVSDNETFVALHQEVGRIELCATYEWTSSKGKDLASMTVAKLQIKDATCNLATWSYFDSPPPRDDGCRNRPHKQRDVQKAIREAAAFCKEHHVEVCTARFGDSIGDHRSPDDFTALFNDTDYVSFLLGTRPTVTHFKETGGAIYVWEEAQARDKLGFWIMPSRTMIKNTSAENSLLLQDLIPRKNSFPENLFPEYTIRDVVFTMFELFMRENSWNAPMQTRRLPPTPSVPDAAKWLRKRPR